MKRTIVVWMLVIPFMLYSQSKIPIDSLIIKGKTLLHATLSNWTEPEIMRARAHFERLLTDATYPWLIHYYVGLADHQLATYYLSKENKDKAKHFMDDGIEHLEKSIELKNDFAESHSLLSSLYGNKIGTNPLLGMTLGPKSGMEMGTATKLAPQNPRNYLIAGRSAFFTPKMFGGGKEKAINYFQQAIACYDSAVVDNPILPDWGHEEAYAWLGLAEMDAKEYKLAQDSFDNALKINPDYGWVKFVLKAELETKIMQDTN